MVVGVTAVAVLLLVASQLVGASDSYSVGESGQVANVSFGGSFVWNLDGNCQTPNPITGSCTCGAGFVPDLGYVQANGQLSVVLCYGTLLPKSAFQSSFASGATAGCVTENVFTKNCSCPPSTVQRLTFASTATSPSVTVCLGPSRDVAFSGAWGGSECNPLFGNKCACPSMSSAISLVGAVTLCGIDCDAANSATQCQSVSSCSWCTTGKTALCLPVQWHNQFAPPAGLPCCSYDNGTGYYCNAYFNSGGYYFSTCCQETASCCYYPFQEYYESAGCCDAGTSCCSSAQGEDMMSCCLPTQECDSFSGTCYTACGGSCRNDADCGYQSGCTRCDKGVCAKK